MESFKEGKKLIFSVEGHIEKIISGSKTQTRRQSPRYNVRSLLSIQPGRTKKGIPEGKIFIIAKRKEVKTIPKLYNVFPNEANAEGGYTPDEFEELYEKLHPGWKVRYCYLFCYYTTEEIQLFKKGSINEAFKKMRARKENE